MSFAFFSFAFASYQTVWITSDSDSLPFFSVPLHSTRDQLLTTLTPSLGLPSDEDGTSVRYQDLGVQFIFTAGIASTVQLFR